MAGWNIPASRIDSAAGYTLFYFGDNEEFRAGSCPAASCLFFNTNYGTHVLTLSSLHTVDSTLGLLPAGGILKAEDAWNIDIKADDGKPGQGKIMSTSQGANADCVTTYDSVTASYKVATRSKACGMIFKLGI